MFNVLIPFQTFNILIYLSFLINLTKFCITGFYYFIIEIILFRLKYNIIMNKELEKIYYL